MINPRLTHCIETQGLRVRQIPLPPMKVNGETIYTGMSKYNKHCAEKHNIGVSLNGAELSVNSANSENLWNH